MTVGVLAEFEPVYVGMGGLGWSQSEVDAMDISMVARFLGGGGTDPVIRGSRGLVLPGEGGGGEGDGGADEKRGRRRPRRLRGRAKRETGRVFRGEAAT